MLSGLDWRTCQLMAVSDACLRATQRAIQSIGLGYDLTNDLDFEHCKWDSPVLVIDDDACSDIKLPGGISVPNVPNSIRCVRGESKRIISDVLSFHQMMELFNQDVSLSGKIPSGHCNAAFGLSGCWMKDAASTKALAFDGMLIPLCSFTLKESMLDLHDQVKQCAPSTWDPAALARLIKKLGTHVILGVTLGGKDAIYVRQQPSSPLQPDDIKRKLKDIGDQKFLDFASNNFLDANKLYENDKGVTFIGKRKGGSNNTNLVHKEWLQTIESEPDIVSVSFYPLSSLISGKIAGSGFLSHAINLYLRYKPPIEDLQQFLEFQLPRQWAPTFGELPLLRGWKQPRNQFLQFSFMGPKLYVDIMPIDVGDRPVTGLRLRLSGRRNNCLEIHLQHLSSRPKDFRLSDNRNVSFSNYTYDCKYYKNVNWKNFSHICTAPVESDEDLSIVTGAKLEIGKFGFKKVLFLRLHFSSVIGATVAKHAEWDNSFDSNQVILKAETITTLLNKEQEPKPGDVTIVSAQYPGQGVTFPAPVQTPKLLRFVDTTETSRGPQDIPGYWVVSGARLSVKSSKIYLLVKYSLLNFGSPAANDANTKCEERKDGEEEKKVMF